MWQSLLDLDGSILLWIQEYVRNDYLTHVVKFITHLGDSGWFWIVLTLLCLIFTKTRRNGVLMRCSFLLNVLANNIILKNLVARIRPYEAVAGLQRIIEAQSDYSFPSGHSGASFSVAVVMLLMFPRKIGVPAIILAVLIALSRLYVGVHYPTDVIGGMLIGTAAALLVCTIYKRKIASTHT
jgi:undecaprenyl-diphosphatase